MIEQLHGMGYPELVPMADDKPRPFWSIVIPVHNRTTYLRQCLASVANVPDSEVLLVDSSDTPIESPGGNLTHHHIADLGPMNNWNSAIRLSRGRWIHLLNDDDYVLPGFFDKLRVSIESSPGVGIASTGYENETDGKVTFRNHITEHAGIVPRLEWLPRIGASNPLNTPAVVIARSTYESIGLYRPDIAFCADWELYRRAACFFPWWSEPAYLARWRQHGEQGILRVPPAAKYDSILKTAELGMKYFPKEIAADVALNVRKHWFVMACKDTAELAAVGQMAAADALMGEARRLLRN